RTWIGCGSLLIVISCWRTASHRTRCAGWVSRADWTEIQVTPGRGVKRLTDPPAGSAARARLSSEGRRTALNRVQTFRRKPAANRIVKRPDHRSDRAGAGK